MFFISGCTSLGGAAVGAAQAYWNTRNPPSYAHVPLQPNITYLEVHAPSSSALMVLAEVYTPQPSGSAVAPSVETWVSGSGELLRTQSGFVVGSAGVPYLPQVAQTEWAGFGAPLSLAVHMPSTGVHGLALQWNVVDVPGALLNKPSPLLKRAQQVQGLQYKAWQANATDGGNAPNATQPIFQLVATHPNTRNLVYGQYCVGGLAQGQCIEYLLRTAASNL
ncbi:hypothetical protein [Limnobacter sp.]|uniref:hypothetical protein n=1 Tax=Limnobacter sp. TaxID=2003368 RepID=UPI003513663C